MIYALIDPNTNVILNVIVADENFIALHCPTAIRIDNLTPVPCIGWRYVNGEFIPS